MADVVWLVRHGNRQDFVDPDWTETADRPHDPGLSPDGIEQARQVGQHLTGEDVDHLFASPFLRTAQTAHHIAEALDLPIRLEPGFGEWLNPAWFSAQPELLPAETLAEQFPRIDTRYTPRFDPSYPETAEEAFERTGAAARDLAQKHAGTLLLVGHGASVTGGTCGLVGREIDMECALCSLTKVARRDQQWHLELCDNVTHLDQRKGAGRLN